MENYFRSASLTLACGFIGCIMSGSAFAQESLPSISDTLAQSGMVETSKGFYEYTDGTTQSFLAIGESGNHTLLQKLLALRAAGIDGVASTEAQSSNPVIDDLITRLSAPQRKTNQSVNGDCTGPNPNGPFFAQALAGGSTSNFGASALAVNYDNSATAVNTTNVAMASVSNIIGPPSGSQTTTTYGPAPAVATQYTPYYPNACAAFSSATVTCPGAAQPAISATAISVTPRCRQ